MFAIAWRHSSRTAWELLKDFVPSEADARTKINQMGRYDMLGREYRIVPVGDPETWHDPVAEQAERLGVKLADGAASLETTERPRCMLCHEEPDENGNIDHILNYHIGDESEAHTRDGDTANKVNVERKP